MKKVFAIAAAALLLPAAALAAPQGIIGDCADCHTMHNSQMGQAVAQVYTPGSGFATSTTPIENLLKLDCIACHANPTASGPLWTLSGGSVVPQVAQPTDNNLAGGNFRYSTTSQRKGHNVIDLTAADASNANQLYSGANVFGAPPGMNRASYHGDSGRDGAGVFTTNGGAAFDAFTCAGARGCHGTRSQLLSGVTVDNGTANNYISKMRTGIAAVSGAHHNSYDGAKTDNGYTTSVKHDGAKVAAGYRFIPGLKAYGNEAARWQNVDSSSHNEYFATEANTVEAAVSCGACHIEGTTTGGNYGLSTRMRLDSTLKVPGNDMSGFCATCHGNFHSAGSENGTSGAFLRHPSDWVLPGGTTEYAAYTTYDITAPVARNTVLSAPSSSVSGAAGDMVMCLSCHAAHATPYDYMLRGDYSLQTAGGYGTIAAAQAVGFCQACHTTKGVLPENR